MKVQATVEPDGRREKVDLHDGGTGMDLLKALDLPPDMYILSRREEILPEDEPLKDGDDLRLVAVVSGGGGQPTT